jgi:hypothetical protein
MELVEGLGGIMDARFEGYGWSKIITVTMALLLQEMLGLLIVAEEEENVKLMATG